MATIYFVVFNQAEVLDFSGPFDVFSMARIATKTNPYDMKLLSWNGRQIHGIHGFKVVPDDAITNVKPGPSDIVIVPGGATDVINAIGAGDHVAYPPVKGASSGLTPAEKADLEIECAAIVKWLKEDCANAGMLASVCVGAFFGARAGIFAGTQLTTHHKFLDLMNVWIGNKSCLPANQQAEVIHGARYVINPTGSPLVVSSGGVSAGLDLSMYLLEHIMCAKARELTQVLMEYNGTTNFAAVPNPDIPLTLRFCGQNGTGNPGCACPKNGAAAASA